MLVSAYAAAFADEAVLCWVMPDPVDRAVRGPQLVHELLIEVAGSAEAIVGELPDGVLAGVSLWLYPAEAPRLAPAVLPPTPDPDPDAARVARRLAVVQELVVANRPGIPHVYLASMGVLPDLRGQGIGGQLLANGLAGADARDLPTYLEASTELSRRLYLRHGFHDHGRPVALPDGGPVLRPMWRPSPTERS
ncbi:GNAT family N-acetyltransferase [Verrucosispora sp. WMMD573]|uniref:GNAT family N-acetyltransferase n=1 Tax=Verrucosispora sp. WMMD573 TaxID=3015149 RepID=UPI00248D1E74|nr:GNAT family N-acetyltransferase [Verrucosispora sp. WMMD573]WBB55577.1 GNAT family N-acetyltransferase [Verrucosispora sp. WMMD573]